MGLTQIIDGHVKELLNQEQELYNKRIVICKKCKLHTVDRTFGDICDRHKWYNPNIGHLSLERIDGYINGCGCRLSAALRVKEKTCPLNKW